jgi:apolipoprotein D and lipocalin family protein
MKTSLVAFAVALSGLCACQTTSERLGLEPPVTVSGFELERYDGTWFEIGSYPNRFQQGCSSTTATYSIRDNGEVGVLNTCTVDGKPNVANGVARAVDLNNGKLEVSFFGPFFGDYWIVELGAANGPDADYTHAVVTSPSRDYLWILSRTPQLDDALVDSVFARLSEQGLDRERFVFTKQP